jgi:hypothetical protein
MIRVPSAARFIFRCVAIAVTALGALGSSCSQNGSPAPSTPPTFVLAWNGRNGTISTVESSDGRTWVRERVHDTVTSGSSQFGPAIANDGGLAWMVMWVDGPELQFVTGLGGAAATAGITWESSPNTGLINAFADSSPALTFGARRWMAAYRDQAGFVRIVRSQPNSATSWEAPVDVRIGSGAASRPVATTHAPGLAFGTFGGASLFVLIYKTSAQQAEVITSTDGLTWSAPTIIGPERKEPVVTVANGVLYAALTQDLRGSGGLAGFETTIYKSVDAQIWREISTVLRTAQNIAGPGFAVRECHFLISEQIGGGLGGPFVGIAQRRSDNLSGGCGGGGPGPGALSFGNDEAVRPDGGSAIISVGNSSARTAIAFADTTPVIADGVDIQNVCLTQSGLIEDCPPAATLVAGKSTLVRARIRSRAGGQPVPVDQAWANVMNAADGSLIVTVQGFAFASDNTTLLPTINDGDDAHFFIPGNVIRQDLDASIDVEMRRGATSFPVPSLLQNLQFRRNRGVPLATVGYDLAPPASATLAAEFLELARMYPVADGVGTMTALPPLDASINQGGVRFVQSPTQPLQVAGPGVPFVNGFVLVNVTQGNGADASGNVCSATVPTTLVQGRQFAFNFTSPEEVDGVPGFSAAELANCQGDPSPLDQRFGNMIAQFNATASQQKMVVNSMFPNDPAVFAASVVTGGGTGQGRSNLVGQCPPGLNSSRLCWNVVGQNFPAIHHEVGHAFGLSHNDGQPAPFGSAYHLLNRVRISTAQVTMRMNVSFGNNQSFFLAGEYSQLHATLNSSDYAVLATRELGALPVAMPAASVADPQRMVLVSGRISAEQIVRIDRIRVLESHERPRITGNEYVVRLLDDRGKEIAAAGFSPTDPTDHPDTPSELAQARLPRFFAATVPFSDLAQRLVIDKAGARLIEVRISEQAPSLRLTQTSLGPIAKATRVTWQASDPDGDAVEFDVYLHYPDGMRRVLATGLTRNEFVIQPEAIPGGRDLALEVAATDGFNTTSRTVRGLELPNHPPEIMIVYPKSGATVRGGGFVTLRAVAADAETGMLKGGSIRWRSTRDGDLGEGDTLSVQLKAAGEHVITATTQDPAGNAATAQIALTVSAK